MLIIKIIVKIMVKQNNCKNKIIIIKIMVINTSYKQITKNGKKTIK